MMGPLVVVEAQVALKRGFELPEPREIATAKLDAPVLVQDGLLEPLDEAVGEGVPRFGACVPDDGMLPTGFVEGPVRSQNSSKVVVTCLVSSDHRFLEDGLLRVRC